MCYSSPLPKRLSENWLSADGQGSLRTRRCSPLSNLGGTSGHVRERLGNSDVGDRGRRSGLEFKGPESRRSSARPDETPMNAKEIERAAYLAAHGILAADTSASELACPG